MAANEKETALPLLFQEKILLVVIPFAGSLVSYAFETGYLSFFGVPSDLIQLDFVRVVTASLVLLAVIALIWGYLAYIGSLRRSKSPRTQLVGEALAATAFLVILFALVDGPSGRWWVVAFLAALVVVPAIIRAVFKRLVRGIPIDRSLAETVEEVRKGDVTNLRTKESVFIQYVLTPIGGLLFLLFFCALVGEFWASSKGAHYVLSDVPDLVFVRKYGDSLVFARFDPATGQLLSRAELRKAEAGKSLELKLVPDLKLIRPPQDKAESQKNGK